MINWKWSPKTRSGYIKYMEETFKEDTLLAKSKHQIAMVSEGTSPTCPRITVKEVVNKWGVEALHEIIDRGAFPYVGIEEGRKK